MVFWECLGSSQEDTMEGCLWRETLGRSLVSHDAVELVGGMCYGNGCQQEITHLYAISCTKTRLSSLTYTQLLHQALAQSLCEGKVQFTVKDTWSFRGRAREQKGRLNPLRMHIQQKRRDSSKTTTDAKTRRFYSTFPYLTHAASYNLENTASHAGKNPADAVERK